LFLEEQKQKWYYVGKNLSKNYSAKASNLHKLSVLRKGNRY
jgi:hypothetical protein